MNGIIKSSFRLSSNNGLLRAVGRHLNKEMGLSRLYSSIWNRPVKPLRCVANPSFPGWSKCSCEMNSYSTKNSGIVQLNEFLEQEISMEQELHKTSTIPSKIDDFEVKLDGTEVTLVKKTSLEGITVKFNVSRSVQSVDPKYEDAEPGSEAASDLKSRPDFDIDIKRGDTTLGFNCSYIDSENEVEADEELPNDLFMINEITLFTGEESDKTYCLSAEILDGCLYDLLMDLLAEKGITSEFVEKMSELSTAYEHSSYISLLRGLKKFVSS